MLSKIFISQSDDRQAAIEVTELFSKDIKDRLVVQLRQDLKHTSKTFTIDFMEQSNEGITYLIIPVSEELEYFKERLYALIGVNSRETGSSVGEKSHDVQLIDDFFESIQKYVQ